MDRNKGAGHIASLQLAWTLPVLPAFKPKRANPLLERTVYNACLTRCRKMMRLLYSKARKSEHRKYLQTASNRLWLLLRRLLTCRVFKVASRWQAKVMVFLQQVKSKEEINPLIPKVFNRWTTPVKERKVLSISQLIDFKEKKTM